MKKFVAVTMIGFMGMVSNVYGMPESNINRLNETIIDNQITEESVVVSQLLEKYTALDGAVSTVIDEEAKVRDLPSTEGDIINFLDKGVPVYVKEQVGNWYLVMIEDKPGYIYKEQLNQTTLEGLPSAQVEEEEIIEEEIYLGEDIVEKAKQYLGNPYVYGGTSLTNGADCSGFTQQIFKQFGISIERTSRAQYTSNGYKISQGELLPGDLVFYGYNGVVSHVAIYAGNNQVIHANTSNTGICMGPLQERKPIIGMKRVII